MIVPLTILGEPPKPAARVPKYDSIQPKDNQPMTSHLLSHLICEFLHDITMWVGQNNEIAATLVDWINPLGISSFVTEKYPIVLAIKYG